MNKYYLQYCGELTSKLNASQVQTRLDRLNILIVLTEGYTSGLGLSICGKATRAYNTLKGFTGIIRLTRAEKEFLEYILNSRTLSNVQIETIKYYTKY